MSSVTRRGRQGQLAAAAPADTTLCECGTPRGTRPVDCPQLGRSPRSAVQARGPGTASFLGPCRVVAHMELGPGCRGLFPLSCLGTVPRASCVTSAPQSPCMSNGVVTTLGQMPWGIGAGTCAWHVVTLADGSSRRSAGHRGEWPVVSVWTLINGAT